MIPLVGQADLPTLLDNERTVLAAQRQELDQVRIHWDREIETMSEQLILLGQRIGLQDDIVQRAQASLENARDLQDRGLQTLQRLEVVEQRFSVSRSQLLELQSAKTSATITIASAQRARSQYLADWQQNALEGIKAATVALEIAKVEYERSAEQYELLTGLSPTAQGTLLLQFALRSTRPNRSHISPEHDTTLFPGDTLIVQTLD